MLQLNAKGLLPNDAKLIIQDYLSNLATEDYAWIEKATGISTTVSKKLLAEIKKLNPYPAKSFCPPNPILYIEPDLIVIKEGKSLSVHLNQNTRYHVNINDNKDLRLNSTLSTSDVQYINTMYKEAKRLKISLQKKYDTLLKCGEKIAETQGNYFLFDNAQMVPMRKKDIANMLHMHPSTITRALGDKYIKSDQGLHPTNFFL